MTQLLVFGGDSLVGSHFVAHSAHRIEAAGRRDPRELGLRVTSFRRVDLTHPEEIAESVAQSSAETVVNFAGATDVDQVERERPADPSHPSGVAFEVNSLAPAALARAAAAHRKRFVTLSTDFVFDGTAGPYGESALPAAFSPSVGWYGWTKGDGERRVRAEFPGATILRIAYPYRTRFDGKTDFARGLLARHRSGKLPPLFDDQTITPTWIPDVSRALEVLVDSAHPGTFHAASPEPTTPRAFAQELFARAGTPPTELARGSMTEFLRRPGATPRPVRGGLVVGRLPALGVALTGWKEGIAAFVAEGGAA